MQDETKLVRRAHEAVVGGKSSLPNGGFIARPC